MYTLVFSHIVDNQRVPLIENGREVQLTVEAESKTATYTHAAVIALCERFANDTRVRRVT